jgi:hypothetical protein
MTNKVDAFICLILKKASHLSFFMRLLQIVGAAIKELIITSNSRRGYRKKQQSHQVLKVGQSKLNITSQHTKKFSSTTTLFYSMSTFTSATGQTIKFQTLQAPTRN